MSMKKAMKAKKSEKTIDEMVQEFAVRDGLEYFSYLESSLKNMLSDVERHKKGFVKAHERKSYVKGGELIPLKNIVQEIEWCMHDVSNNFHDHVGRAARAISKLTLAFKIEL